MLILGLLAALMFIAVLLVWGLYFILILKNKRSISSFLDSVKALQNQQVSDDKLGKVSIIVSAFNEAKVIERKITNISELDYPKDKLEVVIYDDASSDNTGLIADQALKANNLQGTVITNPSRVGLNRSLNNAMRKAQNNLICITDSDVLLHQDSLKNAVKVLSDFENTGGVTGHIQPVFESKEGIAKSSEESYRDFYHVSMLAESSVHSAFPGNGPLIVFNKLLVPTNIPQDYGSTDGNIAINIIKQGLRFLYIPNSIVYEPSPENLKQHQLQKVRRAKRLLQVFLKNRDIAFNKKYGSFGRVIFPLKLAMLALCPLLLFLATAFLALEIVFTQDIVVYAISGALVIAAATILVTVKRIRSLFSSFILHQFYLLIGLLSSFKKSVYWKTIDRSTKLELNNNEVP